MPDSDTKWYWDLDRGCVVSSAERGPADNTLGPYDSPAEAANWKQKVDERNEAWDDADDEWRGDADAGSGDEAD